MPTFSPIFRQQLHQDSRAAMVKIVELDDQTRAAPYLVSSPARPLALSSARRLGGNQVSIGQYNERLILSLLRGAGGLTKAELARRTSLTSQTITVIVNRLESQGLLTAGSKHRGRVGQPSTPYYLHPQGAMTIGIKIGRRQLDYLAMGFDGSVIARQTFRFRHPLPDDIMAKLSDSLPAFVAGLPSKWQNKLIGFGVAMPNDLSGWEAVIGVEAGQLSGWDEIDICAEISTITGYPALVMNDVTAACLAELNFGIGKQYRDFLYIYVGSLVGGGLVLDHQLQKGHLQAGKRGHGAALGLMPLSQKHDSQKNDGQKDTNQSAILLDRVSLIHLEDMFAAAKLDRGTTCRSAAFEGPYRDIFLNWLSGASDALAFAIVNAASLLDLDAVIIDAAIAPDNLVCLIDETRRKIVDYQQDKSFVPDVFQGTQGYDARVLGGAFLPISTHYAADNSRLVKEQI